MIKLKSLRGMTLIELLVTISIIVIMAGVALPIFGNYTIRSKINNDAKSLEQLFAYARAQQNNPSSDVRNKVGNTGNITVKISKSDNAVYIYPAGAPNITIDQLVLDSDEVVDVLINGELKAYNNFFITFLENAKTPTEKYKYQINTTACTDDPCSDIEIKISSTRNPSISKTLQIKNTNAAINQYFSVSIL